MVKMTKKEMGNSGNIETKSKWLRLPFMEKEKTDKVSGLHQ